MPLIEGWELSSDRVKVLEKIQDSDPIGDPLIVSKCQLQPDHGTFVASNDGFAWRIKVTANTPLIKSGKSKWVRWYDVHQIINEKPQKGYTSLLGWK